MPWSYPPEVHEFVKEWSPKLRDEDLAASCNERFGTEFNAARMKAFRGNHGYRNGKKQWTREEYWKYQKHYPPGFYEFVKENSWGVSSAKMAEMVNERFGTHFTATGMKQFRAKQGIKSGVTGWYQKENEPGNKGKKLEEYITDPDRVEWIRQRISQTQYKKGDRPVNELPVGAVVVNSDGYKLRKKQMEGTLWERWEFLHRAVWRENFGPIPDGMVVSFRDSDRLNCSPENLMLITKAENVELTRKKYRSQDPELTDAGLNVIRLKQKAKEKRCKPSEKKPQKDTNRNSNRKLTG